MSPQGGGSVHTTRRGLGGATVHPWMAAVQAAHLGPWDGSPCEHPCPSPRASWPLRVSGQISLWSVNQEVTSGAETHAGPEDAAPQLPAQLRAGELGSCVSSADLGLVGWNLAPLLHVVPEGRRPICI